MPYGESTPALPEKSGTGYEGKICFKKAIAWNIQFLKSLLFYLRSPLESKE